MKEDGFALPILILAIVGILIIGVGGYYYSQHQTKPNIQQTYQPIPSPTINTIKESTSSANMTNWKTYTDSFYGYEVSYPLNYFLSPNTGGYGSVAILTNYDPNKVTSPTFNKSMLKIAVGKTNKPINENFDEWVSKFVKNPGDDIYGASIISETPIKIASVNGIKYLFKDRSDLTNITIYLPKSSSEVIFISVVPGNSESLPVFDQILATFKFLP